MSKTVRHNPGPSRRRSKGATAAQASQDADDEARSTGVDEMQSLPGMIRTPITRKPSVPVAKPRIGLALGGGGARGLAHLLMLEVLDELDIKPSIIAGTSIGAIFGAAYASGLSAAHIRTHTEEILTRRGELLREFFTSRNQPLQRVLSIFALRSAILKPEALLDLVMPTRLAEDFDDLVIPLKIIAADFYTQDEVVFSQGSVKRAIAASMALPALFAPVITDELALMDGGLVNPLPFDTISRDADIIIAINVSGAGRLPEDRNPPSALESIVASLQILQHSIVREKVRVHQPDVLIDVDVGRFHVLEFHKLREVLEAAEPAKEQLRQKLERVLSAETLPAEVIPADDTVSTPDADPPRTTSRRLASRLLGKA